MGKRPPEHRVNADEKRTADAFARVKGVIP